MSNAPDGNIHIVQEGEWVASIALNYGITEWNSVVWQHGNNSDLRNKRKNPRMLAQGDRLYVPPISSKEESRATEAKHKFKLKVPTESYRVRMLDIHGKPLANEEYVLTLDYDPRGGKYKQKKKRTDSNGLIDEKVPSTVVSGVLAIPRLRQRINLKFGFLKPLRKEEEKLCRRGVQERLRSLGYPIEELSGEDDSPTRTSIQAFKQFCKENAPNSSDGRVTDAGDVNSTIDDKFLKALQTFYGC
ncbi:MAG TPA: LysM domain-containing protein [Phycisphaerae bacterium]|nr:LysM domain-containing protein [Phycisphaerae bacterium]